MTLALTPDTEALVGEFLREHVDLIPLHGGRVGTRTPPSLADPWIKITLIDDGAGDPRSSALHFRSVPLQLDCYGGAEKATSHEEASELVRSVRAALQEFNDGSATQPDGAVISGVRFGTAPYLPDDGVDAQLPRPRYALTAEIYIHADAVSS